MFILNKLVYLGVVNLRFDIIGAFIHKNDTGEYTEPMKLMSDLGISFENWEGNQVADCIVFYNCKGVDVDKLPSFLEVWNKNIKNFGTNNIATTGCYACTRVVPACLGDDDDALSIIKKQCIDDVCKEYPHLNMYNESDFVLKVFKEDGYNFIDGNVTIRVEINTVN